MFGSGVPGDVPRQSHGTLVPTPLMIGEPEWRSVVWDNRT